MSSKALVPVEMRILGVGFWGPGNVNWNSMGTEYHDGVAEMET